MVAYSIGSYNLLKLLGLYDGPQPHLESHLECMGVTKRNANALSIRVIKYLSFCFSFWLHAALCLAAYIIGPNYMHPQHKPVC